MGLPDVRPIASVGHNDYVKSVVFLKSHYVLVLFNKLRLLSYDTNAVEKTFSFSDNLKQLAVFDDAIFACSDKRAFVFVREMGQRQLCSVLTGSQVVGVTVDRMFSLRSVIDSKGTQSIKVG